MLQEFNQQEVVIYIDDILIMSRTFDEHFLLVSKVLRTLANYSIRVKLNKCHWFQSEGAFLGHIVGYINSVHNFPYPTCVGKNCDSS